VGAVLNETWDRSRAKPYNKKLYHPGRRPEKGIVPRVSAASADEGFWSGGGCSGLILIGGTVDIRYGEVCHGRRGNRVIGVSARRRGGIGSRRSEVRSRPARNQDRVWAPRVALPGTRHCSPVTAGICITQARQSCGGVGLPVSLRHPAPNPGEQGGFPLARETAWAERGGPLRRHPHAGGGPVVWGRDGGRCTVSPPRRRGSSS
jgi:hypothetical protein